MTIPEKLAAAACDLVHAEDLLEEAQSLGAKDQLAVEMARKHLDDVLAQVDLALKAEGVE